MVIKRKGKSVPGIIGPPPLANIVTRGISIVGAIRITPTPSNATTPSFIKVERYPRGTSNIQPGKTDARNP